MNKIIIILIPIILAILFGLLLLFVMQANAETGSYDLEEELCIGRDVDENCIRNSEIISEGIFSLKQQINENLSFNEILCPNNNHILAERTNGKLSCVYYETAEKLNWTIRDKEVKVNLLLNDDPAVKNCIPKGPDDVYPTMPYRNSTHSFDVGVCEWSEK